MKKELKYIILIFTGFIALLWLAKPLRKLFENYNITELKGKLIAGIIARLFIITISFWIIGKLKFKKYNGIEKGEKVQNLQSLIIPFLFILMGLLSSWNIYINADKTTLILFTASVFIVGLTEELLFRGTILPLFISYFKSQKGVLYFSVIASSLIFGIIHYINIFKEPGNFGGITHQVFFALSIGVFFGGLMLRTKNITIPSLFHGFVNFSFGTGDLKQDDIQTINEKITNGVDWSSLILTTLFFVFIFISGVYMIKKTDKELVLNKLN
ncbi:type II CAAX endopeptidase family protein [Tenacibaculum sp.]|nr:type II CAAX endopeptidase family protein [Tenacibaculum sp.]